MPAMHLPDVRLFSRPVPGFAWLRAGAWAALGSVVLLCSAAACKSAGREGVAGSSAPGWLYVSLKITPDAGRGFTFSVLNQVRAGAMSTRQQAGGPAKPDGETLVFTFYDRREKWGHTQFLQNPLYPEREFFGEDGTVGRKKLSLPEATFTVCAPRAGEVTHLVIRSSNGRELGRFTLGRP